VRTTTARTTLTMMIGTCASASFHAQPNMQLLFSRHNQSINQWIYTFVERRWQQMALNN